MRTRLVLRARQALVFYSEASVDCTFVSLGNTVDAGAMWRNVSAYRSIVACSNPTIQMALALRVIDALGGEIQLKGLPGDSDADSAAVQVADQ